MEMTAITRQEKMIVFLSGEIDHHSAKDIRDGIDKIMIESKPKCMIINLAGIGFMDSSGLGLILGRYRRATELGIQLYISGADKNVLRILKMAGVDKIIKTVVTE